MKNKQKNKKTNKKPNKKTSTCFFFGKPRVHPKPIQIRAQNKEHNEILPHNIFGVPEPAGPPQSPPRTGIPTEWTYPECDFLWPIRSWKILTKSEIYCPA